MFVCGECKNLNICKFSEQVEMEAAEIYSALKPIQDMEIPNISVSVEIKCVHGKRKAYSRSCGNCAFIGNQIIDTVKYECDAPHGGRTFPGSKRVGVTRSDPATNCKYYQPKEKQG